MSASNRQYTWINLDALKVRRSYTSQLGEILRSIDISKRLDSSASLNNLINACCYIVVYLRNIEKRP